jgi:hypothetical protein
MRIVLHPSCKHTIAECIINLMKKVMMSLKAEKTISVIGKVVS